MHYSIQNSAASALLLLLLTLLIVLLLMNTLQWLLLVLNVIDIRLVMEMRDIVAAAIENAPTSTTMMANMWRRSSRGKMRLLVVVKMLLIVTVSLALGRQLPLNAMIAATATTMNIVHGRHHGRLFWAVSRRMHQRLVRDGLVLSSLAHGLRRVVHCGPVAAVGQATGRSCWQRRLVIALLWTLNVARAFGM